MGKSFIYKGEKVHPVCLDIEEAKQNKIWKNTVG